MDFTEPINTSKIRLAQLELRGEEQLLTSAKTQVLMKDRKTSISTENENIRKEIKHLREELKNIYSHTSKLSLRFKTLIKKNELEELNERLDEWKLEQFITRTEFEQLLANSLSQPQRAQPQAHSSSNAATSNQATSTTSPKARGKNSLQNESPRKKPKKQQATTKAGNQASQKKTSQEE
jgi:hypothetical protein